MGGRDEGEGEGSVPAAPMIKTLIVGVAEGIEIGLDALLV